MPKKETLLRFKDGPASAAGGRSVVVSSAVDHGSLSGLDGDDHPQYAGITHVETISGAWTVTGAWTISTNVTVDDAITIDGVDISDHDARHIPGGADALATAAPAADSVNVGASAEGAAASFARSDHAHNLDEAIVPTWTGAHLFQATMTTRDLLPEAQDTYDIGDSTYWYSQMFVSQINAAVFAEEQIALLGGWLYISHDAGSFAAEVESADTKIDFGKAMTVSDFVIVKAYDMTGSIKTEYIQVGALDAGTIYNVTRDLAAAHGVDPNWAAGTPFAVLGQTGDGRIELNAYDAPRIQIIVQDDAVTYSNTTEYLRIGEMNGAFGSDAANEYGLGVGDYAGGNYMTYNTTDGFELKAGDGAVRLDTSGVRLLETGAANSYISWKETDYDGDTIAYSTTIWDGGAADDIKYWHVAYKATGLSAGDAVLGLGAWDVDANDMWLLLESSGQLSLNVDSAPIVNANMTVGLCINQDTNDDEIFACKASEVGHGGFQANTDTFFTIKKAEDAAGGARLSGFKDNGGVAGGAVIVQGALDENTDITKSTAGIGILHLEGYQSSGGAIANTADNGNVVVVRTYRGGAYVTVAIIDEDGDLHLDAGAGTGGTVHGWIFDEYDDLALLTGLRASTAPMGHEIQERFGEFIDYARPILEQTGVVQYNDGPGEDGRPFISTRGLQYLTIDAVRQLYGRLERYERALIELGASPELLACPS